MSQVIFNEENPKNNPLYLKSNNRAIQMQFYKNHFILANKFN